MRHSGFTGQVNGDPSNETARGSKVFPRLLGWGRAITEMTIAAFKTLEISHHTEQFIIEALRAAKALTTSQVAEADGRASVKQVNNYGPDRDAG